MPPRRLSNRFCIYTIATWSSPLGVGAVATNGLFKRTHDCSDLVDMKVHGIRDQDDGRFRLALEHALDSRSQFGLDINAIIIRLNV